MSASEIEEISRLTKRILRTGQIAQGPRVKEFEEKVRRRVGSKHLLAISTGTSALHLALAALRVGPGDEVLVPSDTFVSTANAALYLGAKPILVDVDADTFNISPSDMQEKLTPRCKVVLPVHLGGNPCDMKALGEIASDHKITIVEDATQALGAKFDGLNCGRFGSMGVFSFDHAKLITTAEGGAIATDSTELVERIKLLRNLGRATYGAGSIDEIGFNFRLSEVHAAIGLVLAKDYARNVARRKRAGLLYRRLLSAIPWLKVQKLQPGSVSSFHATLVLLSEDAPVSRDELVARLSRLGIGTSVLFKPIHLWPAYERLFGDLRGTCPVAEELGARGVALPMFNSITDDQVTRVVAAIRKVAA